MLLTHNEIDIIEESLAENSQYVDVIFALDGSTDGTFDILKAHPKVELILRDEDVTMAKVRDFHRQALLDAARLRYGNHNWYTLMHGDEIFHDNPREIITKANKENAKFVNWAAMQFFFHLEDKHRDLTILPIQKRLRWYSPFWVEVRQFRDNPKAKYKIGKHGRVFPRNVGWKPFSRMPIVKHYPYRSIEQLKKKISAPGFSLAYQDDQLFRSTFQPIYKKSFQFLGDFGDFELSKQKNLIFNWLRWLQLVKR